MSDLATAIRIAAIAHEHQTRSNGEPYFFHSYRVMQAMNSLEEKNVAMLHDVIEDTSWTIEDLRLEGFSETILDAVLLLTHSPDIHYLEYINRISSSPLATKVKLADLRDNMDPHQLLEMKEKDWQRMRKYRQALEKLNGVKGFCK